MKGRSFIISKPGRAGMFGLRWPRGGEPIKWRRQGDALRNARKWTEAAEAYARYLEHRPADAAIWIQHGHMLKEAGQWEQAIISYNRSEELNIDDPDRDVHMFHLRERIAERAALGRQAAAFASESETRLEVSRPEFSEARVRAEGSSLVDASLIAERLRQAC